MKYFISTIIILFFIIGAGFAYFSHNTFELDYKTYYLMENPKTNPVIFYSEPVLNI